MNHMNPVQLHTLVSVVSVASSDVESPDRISSDYIGSSSWEAAKLIIANKENLKCPSILK